MLPKLLGESKISFISVSIFTDLCSLMSNVDRFAFSLHLVSLDSQQHTNTAEGVTPDAQVISCEYSKTLFDPGLRSLMSRLNFESMTGEINWNKLMETVECKMKCQ